MTADRLAEVFSARDLPQATMVQSLLKEHGIPARIVNTSLQMAVGDLPWQVITPRVWVHAQHEEQARQLILDWERRPDEESGSHAWECPRCEEQNGPAFDFCWNCSWSRQ